MMQLFFAFKKTPIPSRTGVVYILQQPAPYENGSIIANTSQVCQLHFILSFLYDMFGAIVQLTYPLISFVV